MPSYPPLIKGYSIENIPNRLLMLGTATDRFVRRRGGSEFWVESESEGGGCNRGLRF